MMDSIVSRWMALTVTALITSCVSGDISDHNDSIDVAGTVSRASVEGRSSMAPIVTDSGLPDSSTVRSYLCDPARCHSTGPLEARNIREARWLIANGYPTLEEGKRLQTMSIAQLKVEAHSGNRPALVFYGKKFATESNFLSGLAILRRAAQDGSLYAYYGISEIYLTGPQRSYVDSAAYLRLAYVLGDSKAATELAERKLSGIEAVVADERASSLYKTFSDSRPLSPRPTE